MDVTLKEYVYHFLLEQLAAGNLAPGDKLVEDELARQAKVSRTPLREAIRKLESCGLVVQLPNRGAFVRNFDYTACRDIYEIREMLEVYAAKRAATMATDEHIAEMQKCCDICHRLYQQAESDVLSADNDASGIEAFDADRKFHNLLFDAAQNTYLSVLSENIATVCLVATRLATTRQFDNKSKFKRTYIEHTCLLTAIKERSPQKASEIASLHIRRAMMEMSGEDTLELTPKWLSEMIAGIVPPNQTCENI